MSELFRNTLSGPQWALLAAVPPAIVALYFLKLRRVPLEVPSTYLWTRAIEDMHVNSLWQRLRRSILLLLQLLLVALAILALLRPGWRGTKLEGQQAIFLVDNSASMSATDGDSSGRTRLEVSKERVAALINQMEGGVSAMIISFADTPRVVQGATSNRRLLKERLESIKPTSAPTDLGGALRLAGGLANPGQVAIGGGSGRQEAEVAEPIPTSLYLFTDGRFEAVQDFSLGNLTPVYIPVGERDSGNLAITALNTRRMEARPDEQEAFVQVANYTAEPHRVQVELSLDGQFLDARAAEAPAGGAASFTFPLLDAPAGKLEAKISEASLEAAGDRLAIDDNAFAGLDDAAPGAVLVATPGNLAIETALATERARRIGKIEFVGPGSLEDEDLQRRMRAGEFDLVIYDRCGPPTPDDMPRCGTMFIGELPPTPPWNTANASDPPPNPEAGDEADTAEGEATVDDAGPTLASAPQVIDWNRAHPVMAYVQVGDVLIGESVIVRPPSGGVSLIDSTEGPLLSIAPRDSFEDLVLGFPILVEVDGVTAANTTWFKSRGFPTFWLNVLDYFVGEGGDATRGGVTPGGTVEVRPRGGVPKVLIEGPGGVSQELTRRGEAPFVFQQTDERGVYEVTSEGAVLQRFAVNLFDAAESNIALQATTKEQAGAADVASIRIGYTDVSAEQRESVGRKELWRTLLLVAIGVLVIEWYVYNRRVFG